jgi:hypothetical protein
MGHQIWSYETLDKLCMDAFTAPKFGFTQEQARIITDVLLTSEGGKINCKILPPERDDEIEGWAHRMHLCQSRTAKREQTERERTREEYKTFRADQAAEE